MRYFRVTDAGSGLAPDQQGHRAVRPGQFAWAMTRVNGNNGLTCSMPISDLAVHWDHTRALALLKLVKEDRTSAIGKDLCTPSGLPHH